MSNEQVTAIVDAVLPYTEKESGAVPFNALERRLVGEFIAESVHLMVLFAKKHRKYGPRNVAVNGELGLFFRLREKVERIGNMMRREDMKNDPEPMLDSVEDISVLATMLSNVMKGGWVGVDERLAL